MRNPLADSYRRFRRITHAGLPIAGVGGDRSVIEQAQPPALEWFLRWGRLAPTYCILTDDARHRGGGGSAAAEKLQKVERVERINAADEHERAVDSREVERLVREIAGVERQLKEIYDRVRTARLTNELSKLAEQYEQDQKRLAGPVEHLEEQVRELAENYGRRFPASKRWRTRRYYSEKTTKSWAYTSRN